MSNDSSNSIQEFTLPDYEAVAFLNKMFFSEARQYPMSIQLTTICTLLTEIYPQTGLSLPDFLEVIGRNVELLIIGLNETNHT
jgi:hypothetical protein